MMPDFAGLAESGAPAIPFHTRQVQEVLAHPELKALLARFSEEDRPAYERRLRAAVHGLSSEGLAETEVLVQATKKAFEAVSGKLRVFLSYKRSQHAEVARLLRTSLQGLGAARINVFLDEAKIEPGQDWFNTIRTNLRSANCFVLLVPDDSDEREWPIFEAGIFAGRMLPGERLICLHHPAVPIPHQLAAFQGYQADAAGVERLLRRLLVEPHVVPGLEAINPDCEPFLEQHSLKVAAAFSGPARLQARPTMNFVTLELSRPGEFSDQQDLLHSTVVDARGLSDMFFYTGPVPCELQKVLNLRDGTPGQNERHDVWLAELTDCIREETAHRRAEVPFAKFSTPDGRQTFRPVLRKIEEDQTGAAHRLEVRLRRAFDQHQ
jgi:TIR domain